MSKSTTQNKEEPLTPLKTQEANSPVTSTESLYIKMDRKGVWSITIRQNKYKVSAVVTAITAVILMIYGAINIK